MDRIGIINRLVPDAKPYNPACLNMSEEDARKGKYWTDERQMPTLAEAVVIGNIMKAELSGISYREERAAKHKSIPDQMDMIYWDKKNGTDLWVKYVDDIKETIKKPN